VFTPVQACAETNMVVSTRMTKGFLDKNNFLRMGSLCVARLFAANTTTPDSKKFFAAFLQKSSLPLP
jgi:hypothetical protein